MPLVWAHSEFLKLVFARASGEPIEQLAAVREHREANKLKPSLWHWRPDMPIAALRRERDVRIEMPFAFRLRFGFDGWQHVADKESEPLGFGLHGVVLSAAMLESKRRLDFTYWNQEAQSWADVDYGFDIG